MINQEELFKLILPRFKNVTALDKFIAELMHVTPDMAARYRKGHTLIPYDRLQLLMNEFKIKGEQICTLSLADTQDRRTQFSYISLAVESPENYVMYINDIASLLERMIADPKASLWIKADDVPIFHFIPYKNLIYFKLYAYACDMIKCVIKFEEFVVMVKTLDLDPIFERIKNAYDHIPGIEIWHDGILDDILYQIEHSEILGQFSDSTSKIKLLKELDDMIDSFQKQVKARVKSSGAKFECYRKVISISKGYALAKQHDHVLLNIKTDAVNSMITKCERMSSNFMKFFEATLNKSESLGTGIVAERTPYFRHLKDKIADTRTRLT